MDNKKWIYILFILLTLFILFVCMAWSTLYRLSWVKFTMKFPLPEWLKMLLWGWI